MLTSEICKYRRHTRWPLPKTLIKKFEKSQLQGSPSGSSAPVPADLLDTKLKKNGTYQMLVCCFSSVVDQVALKS